LIQKADIIVVDYVLDFRRNKKKKECVIQKKRERNIAYFKITNTQNSHSTNLPSFIFTGMFSCEISKVLSLSLLFKLNLISAITF